MNKLPITSDLVSTSILNRDLVERHGSAWHDPSRQYTSNQEPVYGFRNVAKASSPGELALAAAMVDDVFNDNPDGIM